jgi:hypothetical protein
LLETNDEVGLFCAVIPTHKNPPNGLEEGRSTEYCLDTGFLTYMSYVDLYECETWSLIFRVLIQDTK